MNKGTHFSGQPMYGQLINLLNKEEILKFSREYNGERYVKRFDAYQHMAIMLYAVIRKIDTLREITDSMFPEARKLAHLGIRTMPMPAGLRPCLRPRTAACMPDTKTNIPRTAEVFDTKIIQRICLRARQPRGCMKWQGKCMKCDIRCDWSQGEPHPNLPQRRMRQNHPIFSSMDLVLSHHLSSRMVVRPRDASFSTTGNSG